MKDLEQFVGANGALGAPRSSTLALDESLSMTFLTVVIALATAIIRFVSEIISVVSQRKAKIAVTAATAQSRSSDFSRADLPQKIGFLIQTFSCLVLAPVCYGLLIYWAFRGGASAVTFREAALMIAIGVAAVVSSRTPKL
jgi:hypothetical protein